jgi:signal transduction histidine kinase
VEVRRRLFEPFVTSKPRGSGLGLYLVREIVLAHGGAIALSGQGGRGTAVVMHWPRAEGAPS